jgi:hypothetical protein
VRLAFAGLFSFTLLGVACASNPGGGTLGEGGVAEPQISAVDTAVPPRSAMVQLKQPAYVALFLVAPGHSVSLLYPSDSATDNRRSAGTHTLPFQVPDLLVETDSQRLARMREAQRSPTRRRRPTSATTPGNVGPIPAAVTPYLLLLTSPQDLDYDRMIEKTGGVSIPSVDIEALNAVAKAIKATLVTEPRIWAGHYQPVLLRRFR